MRENAVCESVQDNTITVKQKKTETLHTTKDVLMHSATLLHKSIEHNIKLNTFIDI